MKIKIFADGADKNDILEMLQDPFIKGFTTNPTLMKKAGITDYESFARDILRYVKNKPISFEVFSDDFDEMYEQALQISGWGENVYVKIPVTNTRGHSASNLIHELSKMGVKQNITALMTSSQVLEVTAALANGPCAFVSVFAGRIADTGRDPLPFMSEALSILKPYPQLELIWASPRELLNVIQADGIGCHIITVSPDIFKKMYLLDKDLQDFSLETVKMFYEDAVKAGYKLLKQVVDDPAMNCRTPC